MLDWAAIRRERRAALITFFTAGFPDRAACLAALRGAAAAGADIRFWEGTTPIGATQADADGRWTFPLPDLAPGTHRLRVVVGGRDNGVASDEWVVTVAGAASPTAARTASVTPAAPTPAASGTPTAAR